MNEDPIGAGDADPGTAPDKRGRIEGFSIEPGSGAPLDFGEPAGEEDGKGRGAAAPHFAPPLAPPPGADQLTIEAYELERYAYEMATRDDPRRTDDKARVPETEYEPA